MQADHNHQVSRLTNGINNLKRTTEQIADLQVKLTELRPTLKENTENAQKQQELIEANQIDA